ncbi:uridine kinase family [Rhizoctonia solani]|uniref:Uridine kinase family n=1 Tax=Rhizoctonia solani TaxID=456999 RepID=A0A8H7I850_9AGAM|nr:uridine kinase family [Rhizoctonia solani]
MPLFAQCLRDLKGCRQANVPIYSFTEHQRMEQRKYLYGANIIIVEGIMALQDPQLRDLYDVKIFVQCDSDLMLARRIKRDVAERGRDVDGILEQYADIVGVRNAVAIDLITTHIRKKLSERSFQFRDKLARADSLVHIITSPTVTTDTSCNLIVLPQTPQLRARDLTRRFHFLRGPIGHPDLREGNGGLPFKNINVSTPTGAIADGKDVDMDNPIRQICSVTIVRAGGMLEKGLRRVMRDIAIGSLLIQSDPSSGSRCYCIVCSHRLFKGGKKVGMRGCSYSMPSSCLDRNWSAALMAIRVLLDHGVAEDHIIFVTFLGVPRGGMAVIRKTFQG